MISSATATWKKKRSSSSLLFVSIAFFSLLLIDERLVVLVPSSTIVEAVVDSPTMSTTANTRRGASPNLGPMLSTTTTTTTTATKTTSSLSDGVNDNENSSEHGNDTDNARLDSWEEDDELESSSKSSKLSLTSSRKQRQKQRQQQRQQQQQQQQQQQSSSSSSSSSQAEYDAYMHWCQKVLGISSVVEIKEFEYIDHLQIHWNENYDDGDDYESEYREEFEWLEQYKSAENINSENSDNNQDNNNDNNNKDDKNGDDETLPRLPTKMVRGLAATHDIQIGDIVISIPLYSLLSIPTTIDHDPVLSRILGPDARRQYGWTASNTATITNANNNNINNNDNADSNHIDNDNAAANEEDYELPLLVLAILYHRSLGNDSPISHYIDVLMETDIDSFPFLWSEQELWEKTTGGGRRGGRGGNGDGGEGVRRLARGLRGDLYEMYDMVMGTLVRERPEWFAPPKGYVVVDDGNDGSMEESEEWIYSYENFQWAFALVVSRHHYLPIRDFDDGDDDHDDDDDGVSASHKRPTVQNASSHPKETQQIMQETLSTVSEVVPPANQPTDSWVDLAKNEEHVIEEDDDHHRVVAAGTTGTSDDDYEEATVPPSSSSSSSSSSSLGRRSRRTKKHSFLAPLADLINFGPPCLTGKYNAEDHAFDLVATCSFEKGEEVTFWYSSDCADVIIANFGFLHPLVPPCAEEEPPPPPDEEDWERKSREWKDEATLRERELWEVYGRMDVLKEEMAVLESRLERCACEEDGEEDRGGEQLQQKQPQSQQQHRMDSMTGGSGSGESAAVEANHKVRIRGRISEQAQLNQEMMEELG